MHWALDEGRDGLNCISRARDEKTKKNWVLQDYGVLSLCPFVVEL